MLSNLAKDKQPHVEDGSGIDQALAHVEQQAVVEFVRLAHAEACDERIASRGRTVSLRSWGFSVTSDDLRVTSDE